MTERERKETKKRNISKLRKTLCTEVVCKKKMVNGIKRLKGRKSVKGNKREKKFRLQADELKLLKRKDKQVMMNNKMTDEKGENKR